MTSCRYSSLLSFSYTLINHTGCQEVHQKSYSNNVTLGYIINLVLTSNVYCRCRIVEHL